MKSTASNFINILLYILTFLIGLVLCVGLWVVVPYNNFALNNSFVSDGYLPEIVMLFLACVVLVINPLLRRFAPPLRIPHGHVVLLTGMLLFAAVIPSNGLFRFFPHCLALDTQTINTTPGTAEAIQQSDLPPSLFPDPIGLDVPTPVSDQLVEELEPGASIPWRAWVAPLLSWGTVIIAFWVLMIGLGAIVYPQWRYNERVAFPLLRVYHALIDDPEPGKLLPPVFRSPLFWFACGIVIILHSFNGLALMTNDAFPKFPLSWNISHAFASGVWQYAPGFLKQSRIYFLFVGLAYFMPARHSFSIWFTILFFGLFVMATQQYMPTFDPINLYDQGCGALIAIAAGILWLGRHHYARVGAAVFRPAKSEEEKTNALAGRLFLIGGGVMFGWFVWAGAGVFWSLMLVIVGVMIMLLVARIVAETGITYVWIIPLTASRLIGFFPRAWTSIATAFLQEAHYILANRASAVSATVMMILAMGLKRDRSPGSNRRLMAIGLFVLILGLLVCGAVHLHMGYNLASSYDATQTPVTGRGARVMSLQPVMDMALGRAHVFDAGNFKFMLFGIALAGGLLFLCARFPGWPLHPIGLIFVHSSIGLRLCVSLCVGWALRQVVVHFFGARAYRAAMPLFMGLILGEIFANAIWTLIPVLGLLFGVSPGEIRHLIIFQYT
ncbi:MAG: DUF6785 family protein [Lentisphaeria bacterium]|nr:DUF6785 family protein [Lentisphaeria bacterium]